MCQIMFINNLYYKILHSLSYTLFIYTCRSDKLDNVCRKQEHETCMLDMVRLAFHKLYNFFTYDKDCEKESKYD